MKKSLKLASLSTLAVLGVASLAACGDKPAPTTSGSTPESSSEAAQFNTKAQGQIDISINNNSNKKKSGVTYQGNARALKYADITLTEGDVLPTWQCFAQKLAGLSGNSVTIKGANDFSKDSYKKDFDDLYLGSQGFTYGSDKIDLVMGDASYFNKSIEAGKLEPISKHLNDMPNFKRWIKNNEDIYNSMKYTDGEVYFTPYFDGLNSIEKMQLFNVAYVEKLLDSADTAAYDTDSTLTTKYAAQVTDGDQQLSVVGADGKLKTITAHYSTANNPVAKQAGTKNGAELVAALKEALRAEYKEALADGTYSKLSEIFTGAKACYNTDDLIALLRCVKTNPKFLTGDQTMTSDKMGPIAPRSAENKRTIDLTGLISWWGFRGMDSENSKFYIDQEGNLIDARTQDNTYTGLNYLHQLYEEGLFVTNFTSAPNGKALGSDEWRSKGIKDGTSFMIYDYNATSSPFNDDVASDSKGAMQPVLPPVVKWSAGKDLKYQATVDGEVTNLKDKYFHFSESNRALKSGGWCIPASSDNKDSAIALMDYLFSEEGAYIQDFGPDSGKFWTLADAKTATGAAKEIATINGGKSPIIAKAVLDDIANNTEGLDWNNYYRCLVGSTQGIGHVREDSLDYQVTVSAKSQAGLSNIKTAISAGAMILAQTSVNAQTNHWFMSVPQTINLTKDELATINGDGSCEKMKKVWASDDKNIICPAINWIIKGAEAVNTDALGFSSYSAFKGIFKEVDGVYRKAYQTSAQTNDLI